MEFSLKAMQSIRLSVGYYVSRLSKSGYRTAMGLLSAGKLADLRSEIRQHFE